MLCENSQPGCVPVKPVGTAEGIGNSLDRIVVSHSVGKRVVVMVHGRVDRSVFVFIYDKNIFVLIADLKWESGWDNIRRAVLLN